MARIAETHHAVCASRRRRGTDLRRTAGSFAAGILEGSAHHAYSALMQCCADYGRAAALRIVAVAHRRREDGWRCTDAAVVNQASVHPRPPNVTVPVRHSSLASQICI